MCVCIILCRASNINLKTGGYTALHLAVLHNQIANVELLLSHGAGASCHVLVLGGTMCWWRRMGNVMVGYIIIGDYF